LKTASVRVKVIEHLYSTLLWH